MAKNSVDVSLPKARRVRGYLIERMPIGRFLQAAQTLNSLPGDVLASLFPDGEDAALALRTLDKNGLLALCARALTVLPGQAVELFAHLSGLDAEKLKSDPAVGLDGLAEMVNAWLEVNNIENFIAAARELAGRARAAMTEPGCKD